MYGSGATFTVDTPQNAGRSNVEKLSLPCEL